MTTIFEFNLYDIAVSLMEYITDWLYQMVVGVFSELFTALNTLGADLFGQAWVKQIVQLFSNLGWALFIVGIVVALFEFAIESQNGRGDPKALSLNILKGFFAVNQFSTVPVQLYSLAIKMQGNMSWDMALGVYPEGSSGTFCWTASVRSSKCSSDQSLSNGLAVIISCTIR